MPVEWLVKTMQDRGLEVFTQRFSRTLPFPDENKERYVSCEKGNIVEPPGLFLTSPLGKKFIFSTSRWWKALTCTASFGPQELHGQRPWCWAPPAARVMRTTRQWVCFSAWPNISGVSRWTSRAASLVPDEFWEHCNFNCLLWFPPGQIYWAKDIIFLVNEHDLIGMQAWLEGYHHTNTTGKLPELTSI